MATIAIRFLTGRAHLHRWSAHPNEGRAEWPPSLWRLLRALVAVAGHGFTSLPLNWDFCSDPGKRPKSTKNKPTSQWPPEAYNALPDEWFKLTPAEPNDRIGVSHLASLLANLSSSPEIWIPRTTFGHTRQYFPIHEADVVKPTGSPVFDTFAVVQRDQPLIFCWPEVILNSIQKEHLKFLLSCMSYFGRAESWCIAELHEAIPSSAIEGKTHWRCLPQECIQDSLPKDHLLERRLTPIQPLNRLAEEMIHLFNDLKYNERELLEREPPDMLFLRALMRDSGDDMADGLDRPMGSRWTHYVVPREAFIMPMSELPRRQVFEKIHVARFALNTLTEHRPVLPPLTDALLIGEKFRAALMGIYGQLTGGKFSENFSGKDTSGNPLTGHKHAFFLPEDEDEDGLIDHTTIYCPRGFDAIELNSICRLMRLRQRSGRPDLLVTLMRLAPIDSCSELPLFKESRLFVSRTPYVPPRHSYRRSNSGKVRVNVNDLPQNQLSREISLRFADETKKDGWNSIITPIVESYKINEDGDLPQYGRIPLKNQHLRCIKFVQHRRIKEVRTGHSDHGQLGGSWRIEFPWPVRGPIALGYGAHFGLGLFVPESP